MNAPWLENLASYSAQILVIVIAGASLRVLLRLTEPGLVLRYWQILLAVCLALPFLEPWQPANPVPVLADAVLASPVGRTATSFPAWSFVWPSLPSAVGFVLVVGATLRLAWTVAGLLQLRALRRRAVWLPASGLPLESSASARPARFYLSSEVERPATFGVLDPAVLLPVRALELDERQLRCILLHELEHVRGRHWLMALFEELMRIVFWFHPAIWWLVRRLQLAREQVIDARVIRRTGRRSAYLEALLEMAHAGAGARLSAASSFLSPHELTERAALIIKEAKMSRTRAFLAVSVIVPLLAISAMAAVWTFPLRGSALLTVDKPEVGDQEIQLVKKIQPAYPREAKAKGVEGTVLLKLNIDETGKVTAVRIVEGPEELRSASIEAVRGWEYKPVMREGKAVPFVADVQVNFKLSKDGKNGGIRIQDDKTAPGSHGVVGGVPGGVPGGGGSPPPGSKQELGESESDVHPEVLEKRIADYPPAAKEQHIQGEVTVAVTIDEKGQMIEANFLTGPEIFKESALAALRAWKWVPAMKDGRPVASVAKVSINYTLK